MKNILKQIKNILTKILSIVLIKTYPFKKITRTKNYKIIFINHILHKKIIIIMNTILRKKKINKIYI